MNYKKLTAFTTLALATALFTGCSQSQNNVVPGETPNKKEKKFNVKPANDCRAIYVKKSLEQNIKNIANNMGFVARIHNFANQNPAIEDIKNIYDLNEELKRFNLKVMVENFSDQSEVKNVYITKINDSTLITMLKSIEFTFDSSFLSAGELIRIFALKNITLEMPIYLNSKSITVNTSQNYTLYELLNKLSQELVSKEIFTSFIIDDDNARVTMTGKPYYIKTNNETMKQTAKKLVRYGVAMKNEVKSQGRLTVLGTFEEQLFAKKISDKQNLFDSNKYEVCIENEGKYYNIIATNNEKVNLSYFTSIMISKIAESNFGEETYNIKMFKENDPSGGKQTKVKTNIKPIKESELQLKTNKKRVAVKDSGNNKVKIVLF